MRKDELTYKFLLRSGFILLFMGFFIFLNIGFTTVSEDGKLSFLIEQTGEDIDGEEVPSFDLEEEIYSETIISIPTVFEGSKKVKEEIALLLPNSMNYLPSTPPPEL
ncbi:hypothetical protein SAMN05216474_2118 [Lishizhenia tianjinensis]|uniref:Uncharacterized protein n=1 Tax=Lishizhenia tianjinensis TaxID=477690 RepID=A0A1I7AI76_9FLAO|nr:hypothetical protein [Lishizhenia tianjinensis]SFT74652.1 hypothetical protein SAMN05216474_2118 [Lishizhenia tianjinensis]